MIVERGGAIRHRVPGREGLGGNEKKGKNGEGMCVIGINGKIKAAQDKRVKEQRKLKSLL